MEELFNTISAVVPLSNECKQRLTEIWNPITVKKGTTFFKEGKVCKHMYFIIKGVVNSYYFKNNVKICEWFRFENDFFTSPISFLNEIESTDNFEALEDTNMLIINYEDYQSHYKHFSELEVFGRAVAEKYYLKNTIRLKYFQFQTVHEKYNLLLKNEPELLTRISLGNIASYLGITQESLSRIRARK